MGEQGMLCKALLKIEHFFSIIPVNASVSHNKYSLVALICGHFYLT